jgi:phosphocarrier protein
LPEHKAIVAAKIGLHARAAAVFVRAVTATGLPVTIRKPGQQAVDARSLLEVMTEDFGHRCEVVLEVEGEALQGGRTLDEVNDALAALSAVLEALEGP